MFRSGQSIHAQSVLTTADLGVDSRAGTEKAVLAFIERSEGVASRWVQFPSGVLLFVTVPDDPHSGAIYLYDRRKGVFYLFEFDNEADGLLTVEDYERLVRTCRLFDFIRRPWRLRSLIHTSKPPVLASFASLTAVG
jgi:hypothetical protein